MQKINKEEALFKASFFMPAIYPANLCRLFYEHSIFCRPFYEPPCSAGRSMNLPSLPRLSFALAGKHTNWQTH